MVAEFKPPFKNPKFYNGPHKYIMSGIQEEKQFVCTTGIMNCGYKHGSETLEGGRTACALAAMSNYIHKHM